MQGHVATKKNLNAMEVKQLCHALQAIVEGLHQDSWLCQEALDDTKKEPAIESSLEGGE
jgi:hypothetical protein